MCYKVGMTRRRVHPVDIIGSVVVAGIIGLSVHAYAGIPTVLKDTGTVVQSSNAADGCIIRFQTATPTILEDANHGCSERITSVYVDAVSGNLVIEHAHPGRIVSCIATPDETLAARGIIIGCSAGLDKSVYTFYSTPTNAVIRADSTAVRGSSSNAWFQWLHEVVEPSASASASLS